MAFAVHIFRLVGTPHRRPGENHYEICCLKWNAIVRLVALAACWRHMLLIEGCGNRAMAGVDGTVWCRTCVTIRPLFHSQYRLRNASF